MAEKSPVATTHRFVVVEGPIGVGKTSLAHRLRRVSGASWFSSRRTTIRSSSVSIETACCAAADAVVLFVSAHATAGRHSPARHFDTVRVADYLIDKDRLFARLTLDDEEFGLYEQVYTRLAIDTPTPDLVIYLQAPVDVLIERFDRRGIRYEQHIEREYLEKRRKPTHGFSTPIDIAVAHRERRAGRLRRERARLSPAARAGSARASRTPLLQSTEERGLP